MLAGGADNSRLVATSSGLGADILLPTGTVEFFLVIDMEASFGLVISTLQMLW